MIENDESKVIAIQVNNQGDCGEVWGVGSPDASVYSNGPLLHRTMTVGVKRQFPNPGSKVNGAAPAFAMGNTLGNILQKNYSPRYL